MVKRSVKQAPAAARKRQRLQDDTLVSNELSLQPETSAPPVQQRIAGSTSNRRGTNQFANHTGETTQSDAPLQEASDLTSQGSLDAAINWRIEADARRDKWLEKHADEIYATSMRREFMGWVELEADPDYFTIMLERLGIEGAKVVEVHSMDEMLSSHHCLKYGIIFLSRYHDDDDQSDPGEELSNDLWFSNQTIDNACATVAILNIINNVSTLDIGENLKSFRDFTKTFSPAMKGEALANFNWCRSIHNALAKRTEMLVANLALGQEATAKSSNSQSTRKGKRKRARRMSNSDIPNHYIAYVPFAGNLWKLDGMDRYPRMLGPLVGGEAWINTVRDDIQNRMSALQDQASAGYSILAIVEDKLPDLVETLGRNVHQLKWTEFCLTEKRDYWNKSVSTVPEDNTWLLGREPIRGPDIRYNLTQKLLDKEGIYLTAEQKRDIAACSEEHLTWIRPDIVEEQIRLRELIIPLKEEREEQWRKYKDGMFDYGPVIHQWMKFLHENDSLGALVDWHLNNEGAVQQG